MKKTIIAIISLTMTAAVLTGCGDRVETDPTVLLQRCPEIQIKNRNISMIGGLR